MADHKAIESHQQKLAALFQQAGSFVCMTHINIVCVCSRRSLCCYECDLMCCFVGLDGIGLKVTITHSGNLFSLAGREPIASGSELNLVCCVHYAYGKEHG
jgi:hypothetical protein